MIAKGEEIPPMLRNARIADGDTEWLDALAETDRS